MKSLIFWPWTALWSRLKISPWEYSAIKQALMNLNPLAVARLNHLLEWRIFLGSSNPSSTGEGNLQGGQGLVTVFDRNESFSYRVLALIGKIKKNYHATPSTTMCFLFLFFLLTNGWNVQWNFGTPFHGLPEGGRIWDHTSLPKHEVWVDTCLVACSH